MIRFSKHTSTAAKGIAIILMLIHHLFSCSPSLTAQYGTTWAPFSEGKVMAFSALAKICVAVFVFLSTYGMTVSLENYNGKMSAYLKRRMLKLMVSFWVVYVLSIATCFLRADRLGVYFNSGFFHGIVYAFADAAGLANMLGTPSYNETWWYMTLAILLIFLTPILIAFYKRFRICALVVIAMLPYLGLPQESVSVYLFTAMLGIWAAFGNLFGLVKEKAGAASGKACCLLIDLALLAVLGLLRVRLGLIYWVDAFMALGIVLFVFLLADCGRLRLPVLSFIGNCSMNIFLIHTLIFEYYFTRLVYAPKNWILITLLLLALSTAASFVIKRIQDAVIKVKWFGITD